MTDRAEVSPCLVHPNGPALALCPRGHEHQWSLSLWPRRRGQGLNLQSSAYCRPGSNPHSFWRGASFLSFQLLWKTRAQRAQREQAGGILTPGRLWGLWRGWGAGPGYGGLTGQRQAVDARLSGLRLTPRSGRWMGISEPLGLMGTKEGTRRLGLLRMKEGW